MLEGGWRSQRRRRNRPGPVRGGRPRGGAQRVDAGRRGSWRADRLPRALAAVVVLVVAVVVDEDSSDSAALITGNILPGRFSRYLPFLGGAFWNLLRGLGDCRRCPDSHKYSHAHVLFEQRARTASGGRAARRLNRPRQGREKNRASCGLGPRVVLQCAARGGEYHGASRGAQREVKLR